MKKTIKALACVIDLALILAIGATAYWNVHIPDSFSVVEGEKISLAPPINFSSKSVAFAESVQAGTTHIGEIKLLNTIPVKTVDIKVVDRKMVRISGAPFGIKMFTDGLIVVGMSDVSTQGSRTNPAKEAGVKVGDMVETINGVTLRSNEQLGGIVEKSNGEPITLRIRRGDDKMEITIKPVQSVGDGKYRLGIWVRDSSAGIGTMTYFDPNTSTFTGLGHPVCDIDTGALMPLQSGEIVSAYITGFKRGVSGTPGELKGKFNSRAEMGKMYANTPTGVYGRLTGDLYLGEEVPLAFSHEIEVGPATIFTTIEGSTPSEYAVEIERIDVHESNKYQNMVIRVTDPVLLEKTGGIVQGMSGSPIIQNGKLIGSVTHVLVGDPTRGYGIFAENIDNTYKTLSNRVEGQK